MTLSEGLQKLLAKKYEPSALTHITYKSNDIAVKADKEGNAVLMFIGKRTEQGSIKGKRYARTLKYDAEGKVLKDHWELKGKAS